MSARLKELRDTRMKHVTAARTIMDKAKAEKRDLTDDENRQVDAAFAESDKVKAEIATLEASDARARKLEEEERDLERSNGRRTDPANPGRGAGEDDPAKADYVFEARRRGTAKQEVRFKAGTAEHRRHMPEYRKAFRAFLAQEHRALQSDLDTAGGYIVAPEQFVMELISEVDDEVMIRGLARKFTTLAQTIGAVRRTARSSTFTWGSELSEPVKDNSLRFGKRSLSPHYMTGEIVVSRDLLRSAIMNVEEIVRAEIARDAGELEEEGFLLGDGAGKPLGLFVASPEGITTARDVSQGNSSTAVTFDGLINAKFSLKEKYRRTANWLFHRLTVGQIRKLKDGNGQYLWQPSVVAGEPDRILELPYRESEWVPNTMTANQYVGLLGNLNYYWIVDGLDLGMQILVEKYSGSNQVGYLVRRKVDGGPTLDEAFTRVKLGA